VLERFKNVDLHPDQVDNPTMGTIFEELIRKFTRIPVSTSHHAMWCI
jgi:type I restriction enzyme M protein